MNQSRRGVLAACSAGLAALAGCSSGEETPSYDTSRIEALRRVDVPQPPATFPVEVTDAMVSRHYDRARTLVERVPGEPDVPDDDVRERLREDRGTVVDRLDAAGDTATGEGRTPLRRLSAARRLRGDAAAVEAAYRAATGAITRGTVTDRRARLRSALATFERDWTYRGDDPAAAVVVHRAFERLRQAARPAVVPYEAFPENPTRDPFDVGEQVRHLENGDAALSDAERLRTRYRESLSDPRSYWTAISVAAGRLERRTHEYREDLNFYIDTSVEDLPFDRSIAGTPLERLYVRAVDGLELYRSDAEEARHRGDPATMVLARAIELTVLRGLDAVVADIENERVAVPETVDGIENAREAALDSLEAAWSSTPAVLAPAVARWSWLLIADVPDRVDGPAFEDRTPDTTDAVQIWAIYATADRVASAVPPTVADTQQALRAATE